MYILSRVFLVLLFIGNISASIYAGTLRYFSNSEISFSETPNNDSFFALTSSDYSNDFALILFLEEECKDTEELLSSSSDDLIQRTSTDFKLFDFFRLPIKFGHFGKKIQIIPILLVSNSFRI